MPSESDSAPSCSVVICTRDRPEHLDSCLRALASLTYPRFDVLVVDNAPSDGRAWEVARRWRTGYVVEPRPGLSRARNRGARTCAGDIVAYIDDDAIADPRWLHGLAAEFADPRVMAVTGRVLPLESADEEGRKCAWIAGADRGPQRRVYDLHTDAWFACANFGGIGIGANMALRKDAFRIWPGFNPSLGRGGIIQACEENHAFFELIAAGYRVVYAPAAIVLHHAPTNLTQLREQHLRMLTEAGAYLAFMLTERPEHRSATVRFILDGIRGRRRIQNGAADNAARVAPRWRELYAGVRGGMLYAAGRISARLAGQA